MNEINEELTRIEAATTPASRVGMECSGEDAPLRESWLLLGQLLERGHAARSFDETAFLARMSAPLAEPAAPWRPGWLLPSGVLAASALICIAAAWLIGSWWNGANGALDASGETNRHPKTVARENDHPELSWEDSLDERIANISQVLLRLESGSSQSDGSLELLDAQLEQMGRDMDSSL